MILLLPNKGSLGAGQTMPMIQVPISAIEGGEFVELNDFQWWAKTSDWQNWLKSNPRTWQAESEDHGYLKDLFDYPHHSEIKRLKTFEDFAADFDLLNEDEEGDPQMGEAYLKFLKAKDNLEKSGKIDGQIEFENVQTGEDNAWFLSFSDEGGTDSTESEMAYKIKKKYSTGGQFAIYDLTEIQPLNKTLDDKSTFKEIFEKSADFFGKALPYALMGLSGFVALKAAGGLFRLVGLSSSVKNFAGKRRAAKSLANAKSILTKGGKWAFRGLKNTGKLLAGVTQGLGKGFKWAKQGYKFSRNAAKTRPTAVMNSIKAFGRGFLKTASKALPKTAVEAIPVVGWILAIGDVAQQTYNWFSDNQAPRFADFDGSAIAHDSFEPGKIPAGEIITICWTQEGKLSSGWEGFLPFTADDTRTTMDIAKIGDFSNSSLFILLNVGSKGMSEALAKNDITFIVFEKSSKFEHGFTDNDDLQFRIVGIQNASEHAEAMYFHGICPWATFMDAYDTASPQLVELDPSAPDNFEFNFQQGASRVNVSGELVDSSFVNLSNPESGLNKMVEKGTEKEIDEEPEVAPVKSAGTEETPQQAPADKPAQSEPQKSPELPKPEEASQPSESRVLNFSSFMRIYESAELIVEADAEEAGEEIDFNSVNVAIYRVNSIENADRNSSTAPPKFDYFVVDATPEVWGAQEGDPIDVASDEYDMEDTRKGFAPVIGRHESEWLSIEPIEAAGEDDAALDYTTEPDEEIASSYIEVADDQVKLKIKDDIQKMKDTAVGGFNLLKELTTEDERKQLGIDKWEEVDVIKVKGDPLKGEERSIKMREKKSFGGFIPNGAKKTFTPKDGELYYLATSIFNRMKNKVRVR